MSGGPPHHPHGRQVPTANPAWNHLQVKHEVPNFFPGRQPQHAHMSNDHSFLHQPTWHTPTTESMKTIPHSHLFSLEQMLSDRQFTRHAPGVDLSVTRNGNQNGDIPTSPISLSVRDTNKINSLPPSALEVQAVELTKCPSPGVKPLSPSVKPASPGMKSVSPGLKSSSPGLKSVSPGLPASVLTSGNTPYPDNAKNFKRANKRVDSILERLNPSLEKNVTTHPTPSEPKEPERPPVVTETAISTEGAAEKPPSTQSTPTPTPPVQSVIVQATVSSHDENSSSSSTVNVPTPTNTREEDVLSPCSNEDSLDSNKSRRKRKPAKTVRVSKEDEKAIDSDNDLAKTLEDSVTEIKPMDTLVEETPAKDASPPKEEVKVSEEEDGATPAKTRRKTSSESETIDNIAAMVQEAIEEKKSKVTEEIKEVKKDEEIISKPVTVSVIKTKENLQETLSVDIPKDPLCTESSSIPVTNTRKTALMTPAQKKATNTHFVEVENKLEEMFAGIEDTVDPLKTDHLDLGDDSKMEEDSLLKLDDNVSSISQDVTSTSNETSTQKTTPQKKTTKKTKVKATATTKKTSESVTKMVAATDVRPKKKKKGNKKLKAPEKQSQGSKVNIGSSKLKTKKPVVTKQPKIEISKDIYAYDSGSNASSNKSKGPFIHIRGPRDSPISVNVVNTPTLDEDAEKKPPKTKKYHDDSEYRHKVRSKGLHSSTLSNKYDAQTRDVNWICAFCKRGPHGSHSGDASQRNFDVPLGDLFGPYVIGTSTPEFERKMDDPYDKQFKSKKIVKMIELTSQPAKVTGKKAKRKYSDSFENRSSTDESDIYLGITDTGNKMYEVWAHEDCIVWSLGVYLVGSKIVGLEEAVWTACNVLCSKCKLKGANICCLNRSCTKVLHYCCAKSSDWVLDEENFKAYCSIHKLTP